MVSTNVTSQSSPAVAGFARLRKSRACAEAYNWYVAQAIPQIDAKIAEKGHFWMETSWEVA